MRQKYYTRAAVECRCKVFQVINRETGNVVYYDKDKNVAEAFCSKQNRCNKTRTRIKISKYDFNFTPVSYGRYKVTYTSPVTGRSWSTTTTDIELIDRTKNTDNPKVKDLEFLKWFCKNN